MPWRRPILVKLSHYHRPYIVKANRVLMFDNRSRTCRHVTANNQSAVSTHWPLGVSTATAINVIARTRLLMTLPALLSFRSDHTQSCAAYWRRMTSRRRLSLLQSITIFIFILGVHFKYGTTNNNSSVSASNVGSFDITLQTLYISLYSHALVILT